MFYLVIWYLLGVSGYIYWWTSEHNLTLTDGFMALFAGTIGPLAWLVGWGIHGDFEFPGGTRIIIKKRK